MKVQVVGLFGWGFARFRHCGPRIFHNGMFPFNACYSWSQNGTTNLQEALCCLLRSTCEGMFKRRLEGVHILNPNNPK